MKSINKVALIGAVGKDPEVRYTGEGLTIASFSLATSEKRKDKEEVTQWHQCVAFGKLADIVKDYIKKGSKLYVDGTIQYQTYEKDGEKKYVTKIVVNDISMLSSNDNSSHSANQHTQKAHCSDSGMTPAISAMDDDIPF